MLRDAHYTHSSMYDARELQLKLLFKAQLKQSINAISHMSIYTAILNPRA